MYYMRDLFKAKGTNPAELLKLCSGFDSHTVVRKMNYAEAEILHYVGEDEKKGKIYVSLMYPGDQVERVIIDGVPHLLLPDIGVLSRKKIEMAGGIDLVGAFRANQTAFSFHNFNSDEFVFLSEAFMKTLCSKFRYVSPEAGLERDLMLAKQLGEANQSSLNLYTTLRSNGAYHLGIGLYATDPKRASWEETVKLLLSSRGRILRWELSQKEGLKVSCRFEIEQTALSKTYHSFPYRPFHVVIRCDSGYISDMVASAWEDQNDENAWFISGTTRITGSLDDALQESMAKHIEFADAWSGTDNQVYQNKETFLKAMSRALNDSCFRELVGTRAKKEFLAYMAGRYHERTGRTEAKKLAMEAIREHVFMNSSEYADRMARRKGAAAFIMRI